jgi:hypothetical protein
MISYQLIRDGYEVLHVLRDGTLKTQEELEAELLNRYAEQIPQPTIFEPNVNRIQQLEAAYKLRNFDVGWTASQSASV